MVHFVGAGSGAVDLITIRGHKLLSEADVCIYAGSLVNPGLLQYVKEGCVIHDSAFLSLEQVIEIIVEAEAQGMTTVRLHTGDPSIYGAIREQIDELVSRGIQYDICPGVSSMSGAAAALGLEYTLPGISQSVIITRQEGRTPVPDGEKLSLLASHGATMVLFLSSGMAKSVSEDLIRGGRSLDTPVAVVYKASWPDEKIIHTTIGNMAEDMETAGINKTALIIVGEVLGNSYERSKLYDPEFSTGFRNGTKDNSSK